LLANTKKYLVAGVGVAIIIAIAASFTSYLGQIEDVQKQDESQSKQMAVGSGFPALGLETAPITIVEFGDYQCEMCKKWYDNTRPKIIENYIDTGKASLTFIDLPILGPDSKLAAEATYCADDQGRYWDYHVTLYDYQGHMNSGWASVDRLHSFAFNLGLDMDEFEECLNSKKYEQRVQFNSQKARSSGANSTPTFVIVNSSGDQQQIRGAQPYSVFEKVIESLL
jgi:protein-disulfide isomerase|tara:strand:- start:367 stop:1041 length:675 start_codon:yes stop_codon:yes gene_type:complete